MNRLCLFCVSLVVSLVGVGQARAGLITFEGIAPSGGTRGQFNSSVVSNGFNVFQFQGTVIDSNYFPTAYSTHNGTDWLMNHSGALNLTKVGGGSFTLNSLEIGYFGFGANPNDYTVTISGLYAGGGSINQVVQYGSGYQSVTFSPAWTNLSRVRIIGFSGNPYAIDNIAVDQVAAVPEPTSLTLLSLGALGVGGYAWRKRRRAAQPAA